LGGPIGSSFERLSKRHAETETRAGRNLPLAALCAHSKAPCAHNPRRYDIAIGEFDFLTFEEADRLIAGAEDASGPVRGLGSPYVNRGAWLAARQLWLPFYGGNVKGGAVRSSSVVGSTFGVRLTDRKVVTSRE
jgi:hypothetical protein